ncbi:MAG: phosphoribosylformylglycinamidine cyclo-ligase [Clostridia bacterium]
MMKKKLTYKDAGVDINAGNQAVNEIKDIVKSTHRPEVISGLGGFGGLFKIPLGEYKEPVLVAGTDGVGTKLKLAFLSDYHQSVGIDLVAMCVNDILAQGAEPLFFLDYIASSNIEPSKIKDIVLGIAEGCKQSNCAILGGETAELPGFYQEKEYDLAGFSVGIVDNDKLLPKANMQKGDSLIGIKSSGIHSNGFSLVRKIVFDVLNLSLNNYVDALDSKLEDVLLEPTKIYVKEVLPLVKKDLVKGIVHVTGGGFYENVPRILDKGLAANIKKGSWPIPKVFTWLSEQGNVEEKEMFSTFNMGIGMILVVDNKIKQNVLDIINQNDVLAYEIGSLVSGKGVIFDE